MRFFVILLVLFVKVTIAHSQDFEEWQLVQGKRYSFILPDHSRFSEDALYRFQTGTEYNGPAPFAQNPSESQKKCPVVTNLYKKIWNRLVSANGLQAFIKKGPGLRLNVDCNYSSYTVGLTGGPRARDNIVVMPISVGKAANSEDEVAIVMAHEIAHILLGHTISSYEIIELVRKYGKDSPEIKRAIYKMTASNEPQADHYGSLLAFNAGYNPSCLKTALENLSKLYKGSFAYYLERVGINIYEGEQSSDDGHGTSTDRDYRVKSRIVAPAGLAQVCKKSLTQDLINTRKEFNRINDYNLRFLNQ